FTDLDGGGLARAVGSEKAETLARTDVEIDAVYRDDVTVGLAEVADEERRGRTRHSGSLTRSVRDGIDETDGCESPIPPVHPGVREPGPGRVQARLTWSRPSLEMEGVRYRPQRRPQTSRTVSRTRSHSSGRVSRR